MTMCSICGIVSVPAGSLGYGSESGWRSRSAGRPAAAAPGANRHAPLPAKAPAASPPLSTLRLLGLEVILGSLHVAAGESVPATPYYEVATG